MVRTQARKKQGNIFLSMMPVQRFIISLILAVIVYLLIMGSHLNILVKIMIAWSVFAFSYIVTSWIVFFGQKPAQIRELSKKEDGSRLYVFWGNNFTWGLSKPRAHSTQYPGQHQMIKLAVVNI